MRRWIAAVLSAALCVLSGCSGQGLFPYAREMGDAALLRTMGVDGTHTQVELTVSTGSSGANTQPALVLSAEGPSLGTASQRIQGMGDVFVYYGYVDQLLLSEERAMLGVDDILDYLGRDNELGLGVQVWVVRDGTASQAIKSGGEKGISARLEQMGTDAQVSAASSVRTVGELMTALAQGDSTYLPAVSLKAAREGDGGQGGEYTLSSDGYAVLRQGKLVGFVRGEAALGLDLLEGNIFGRVEELTLEDGARVTLRMTGAQIRCEPVFYGGELGGVDIVCQTAGQVIQSDRQPEQRDTERLQRELERLTGERIAAALGLAQYWDADYMGLKRRTGMSSPNSWSKIETQWGTVFRGLNLNIEVDGRVERMRGGTK